jgi:hypothetical protein
MTLLSIALLLFAVPQDKAKGISVFDGKDPVAVGETPSSFKDDASLSNGRITLVLPKGAARPRSARRPGSAPP